MLRTDLHGRRAPLPRAKPIHRPTPSLAFPSAPLLFGLISWEEQGSFAIDEHVPNYLGALAAVVRHFDGILIRASWRRILTQAVGRRCRVCGCDRGEEKGLKDMSNAHGASPRVGRSRLRKKD